MKELLKLVFHRYSKMAEMVLMILNEMVDNAFVKGKR